MIIECGKELTLVELIQATKGPIKVSLSKACLPKIQASCESIQQAIQDNKIIYGVNTGFGALAKVAIPVEQLKQLQTNLIVSHAVGVGKPMSDEVVRLMLLMKIHSLGQGFSGVRLELIEALMDLLNQDALPVIPEKGSVGASGDLAPLSHMAGVLLGVGQMKINHQLVNAKKTIELGPKEGLALINGTQASTALAIHALINTETLFESAVKAGALSFTAAKGNLSAFDEKIHLARKQKGQIELASKYRDVLKNNPILKKPNRIQDPYCLRCMPQVMGACWDTIGYVKEKLLLEANAVTDNPLVFSNEGEVLSGGNFHAEPVAFAADMLALAIAEIGALSERRIAMLIDEQQSGLPAFLVKEQGLNSGFMIPHVTAAALASENKALAHPRSVDSLPTSANQEDHVSMATNAARRLHEMLENTSYIVGIELMAAAQGIEHHRPLKASEPLEALMQSLRSKIPALSNDRYMAPDLQVAATLAMPG